MIQKLIIISFILLISFSCEKEVVPPEEPLGPGIEILSPTALTNYTSGETLILQARIEQEGGLHEYLVTLTNKTTNEELASWSEHSHDDVIDFYEEVPLDIEDHFDWELKVQASDHNGNTATESVLFYVNHG